MRDNQDDYDDDTFDFDVEFKEVSQGGLINSLEKTASTNKNSFTYTLTTLDGEEMLLDCTIAEGIRVRTHSYTLLNPRTFPSNRS